MQLTINTPISEHYKELSPLEALLLCYIQQNVNEEGLFVESDKQIAHALSINQAAVPSLLSKLIKLVLVENIHSEDGRLLKYIPIGLDANVKSAQGFIYIMEDTSLPGYYKVGYSGKPAHREYTLQAQKPTIKLLKKFVGSIQQEHQVHRYLDRYRVRGEWLYGISVEDIEKAIKKIIGVK